MHRKINLVRLSTFSGYQLLLTFLFLIFCSSCIGDGAMRVKGHIVDRTNVPISNCELELYLADNNRFLKKRTVSSNFEESFVIDPRAHEYYFNINCGPSFQPHKTDTYKISGGSHYSTPLDLGTVTLDGSGK